MNVYLSLVSFDVAVFLFPSAISLIEPLLICSILEVLYIESYTLVLPVVRLVANIFLSILDGLEDLLIIWFRLSGLLLSLFPSMWIILKYLSVSSLLYASQINSCAGKLIGFFPFGLIEILIYPSLVGVPFNYFPVLEL